MRLGSPAAAGRRYWLALALAAGIVHADESVAPYVPTPEEDVELMLEVGGVGPGDYVIDLGSGDGRIVIAAAQRGAIGHGVELEPELVALATANARAAGVAERAAFVRGDIFAADIAAATVITIYLFPEANIALRPKLLGELRPGTRVLSNSFHMDDWSPDAHDMTARSSGGILLWIVPAEIEGSWALELDGDAARHAFTVRQRYQEIELESADAGALDIGAATLRGDRLEFTAEAGGVRYAFSGRVAGGTIEGYVHVEQAGETRAHRWSARRSEPSA